MKKKRLCSMLFFWGILMLLTGCQGTDQVKLDIYQYLNTDVRPVVSMHNTAISDYNAFMQEEVADIEALVSALERDIIPAMEEAQTLLAGLSYESEEVNDFAKEYQDVIGQEKAALESVLNAVKNKDQDSLEAANDAINSAMSALNTYQKEVRNFAASYGITLVEQDESTVEE